MHLSPIQLCLLFNAGIKLCDGFQIFPSTSISHASDTLTRNIPRPTTSTRSDRRKTPFFSIPPASRPTSLYAKREDGDDPEDNKQPALMKIFDGISLLFSYCIQFLGVAFSLGLVLYLCGFGYTFDLDNGLEIDRIENMRRELQFRREIVRSSNSPPDN